MKGIKSRIRKTLPVGARLVVADNSGARIIQIIGVKNYKGVKRRIGKAGIADIVMAAVKKGNPDIKHKVVPAIIIRQRGEIRRHDGTRIRFDDNAAILLKDAKGGEPKGTVVKGPVAREVIERFPTVGKVASVVV
jgi:large subunit ribosomal protein L14